MLLHVHISLEKGGAMIMSETKYSMVKNWIKSRVLDGTFEPHQKISSESELMKQFNVSRHTVRLALGDLVNEGLLYKEQGSGTFVSDRLSKPQPITQFNKKTLLSLSRIFLIISFLQLFVGLSVY